MSHFLASKKIKAVLWILGGIAALLIVFGLGIAVGYHKAAFAVRWEDNYEHNFYGVPAEPAPWNTHGVAGSIIDVATGTISVRDQENNERSIIIIPETLIRAATGTIAERDLVVGDMVTVIGEPNAAGQLTARFIRVLSGLPPFPLPPPPASPTK